MNAKARAPCVANVCIVDFDSFCWWVWEREREIHRRRCSKQLIWISHIWPSVFTNWKLENISPESATLDTYMTQESDEMGEWVKRRGTGKEIIYRVLVVSRNPTNQSKHWRIIIVGFININKIPFVLFVRLMQYLVVVYHLFIM